ncbi:MAG: pyridoxal phosphate-dependent aminotransferase [Patescibacteria group bacterium]|nr:pyridoxal phosphate-dependent aminotransferase [Patescibacteria group bacterium]
MLSRAVSSLTPSATLKITALAKQMAAKGESVISFGAGEPDFDTPEAVKQAAKKAIDEGFTKYTASTGIPELKQAICDKFLRDNEVKYELNQVMASNGAKQILFEIIFSLCQAGDEVIIPAPFWVSFTEMVKASGAKGVVVPVDKIIKAMNKKSKLLILNYPSNPTGKIYTLAYLKQIAQAVLQWPNLMVVSDECYDQFYYTKQKSVSFASLSKQIYEKTFTVNACSKSFSMTGWRLGYCGGPVQIIEAMGRLQDHLSSNPCSISQKAAVAALTQCRDFPAMMRTEFKKRRQVMVEGLNKILGIKADWPDGAFYVWANISQLNKDSMEFSLQLLEKTGVAVIPGKPFGGEGFIRLSFATSMENIKEGLQRIKKHTEKVYG